MKPLIGPKLGPVKPPPTPEYATYCDTRTSDPHFKIHSRRGHALSALSGQNRGILYHYENGEWVEIFRIDSPVEPEVCADCGKTTMKEPYWSRRSGEGVVLSNYGKWKWAHKPTLHRIWVHSYSGDCAVKK